MTKDTDSKAIVFDMDGTLLDSLYYWRNMDVFAAKAFDFKQNPEIKLNEQPGSFFERITSYVNLHGYNHDNETVKEELYRVGLIYYKSKVAPKKNSIEFLEYVLSKGRRIGVATATNGNIAKQALAHMDMIKYFDFVLSNDDIGIGKSHPDIYFKAAEMLGSDTENTIVFEDNCRCVNTAKKAGFRVAGILDKNFTDEENERTKSIADWHAWDYTYYLNIFGKV